MPTRILISGNFLDPRDWERVEGAESLEVQSFPKLDRLSPREKDGLRAASGKADLAVISLFGSDPDNIPTLGLEDWKCRKALWSFDSHHSWKRELKHEALFERLFIAHSPYLKFFPEGKAGWLPCSFVRFGMDALLEILRRDPPARAWDILFPHKPYPIGNRDTAGRAVAKLLKKTPIRFHEGEFPSGEPYIEAMRSAGAILNFSLLDDLNIRNFEAWALGRPLLANRTPDHPRLKLDGDETIYFDRNLEDFPAAVDQAMERSLRPCASAQAVLDGHMLIHRYVEILNTMLGLKLRVRPAKAPEARVPTGNISIPRLTRTGEGEHRHSNIGVSILANAKLAPAPKLVADRLQIEDNIGESIHVHWRNLRLDFTVKDFLALAGACEVSLKQMGIGVMPPKRDSEPSPKESAKTQPAIPVGNLDPVFLKEMGDLAGLIEGVEVLEKPLSELRCIVKSGNPAAPDWKGVPIDQTPAFRFLKGETEEYSRYVRTYSLPSHNADAFRVLEKSLLEKGYPDQGRYIVLFGDEPYIRDGQHRAALLRHHLGETTVPVLRVRFHPGNESWRMTPKSEPVPAVLRPASRYAEIRSKVEAIKGYMMDGQEEALFTLAKSLPDNAVIVEIGSFQGRSTVSMGYAIRGTGKRIYAIDTFEGNAGDFLVAKKGEYVGGFLGNVSRNGLERWIQPIRGLSHDVAVRWGTPIDFIFIDGSHAYEDVKRDYELFFPFVKPGGIIAFHDVIESWPGPLRLWKEIAHTFQDTGNVHSLYWGRKPVGNPGKKPGAPGENRTGWTPVPDSREKESPDRLLWVRMDSIGDGVLAAGMLGPLRKKHPKAEIRVACWDHTADLYRHCPDVDGIFSIDKPRAEKDLNHLREVVKTLRDFRPDLVLHSTYSREAISDAIALGAGGKEAVALAGDLCNIDPREKAKADALYTRRVDSPGERRGELQRHRDFLAGLGIETDRVEPKLWLGPENLKFAEDCFRRHNLIPEKTAAFFAGSQIGIKHYDGYGHALLELVQAGATIIALGGPEDRAFNQRFLDTLPVRGINFCGETGMLDSAALLSKCRMALGADTGLAHMACALGISNVVLLGGGHFGRFFPYSHLTSVVCLPLDCYGCNWNCRHERAHCITDIPPNLLKRAARETWNNGAGKLPAVHFADIPATFKSCLSLRNPEKWISTPVEIRSESKPDISVRERIRVSAIVSAYNSARLLPACLADLAEQTLGNQLEVIVIDSGSEQEEGRIVEEYRNRIPNLRYLRTPRETLYAAWNRGLQMARGEYVTNANTDDAHLPSGLQRLAETLDRSPDAEFAYAWCDWTKVANDRFQDSQGYRHVRYPDWDPAQGMLWCFLGPHPVWKRSLFEKVGPFDPSFSAAGDFEMQLRLIQSGHRGVLVPEVLSLFYQNPEGLTYQDSKSGIEVRALGERYRKIIPIHRLRRVDAGNPREVSKAWLDQGVLAMKYTPPWLDEPVADAGYAALCFNMALEHDPESAAAKRCSEILTELIRRQERELVADAHAHR